MGIDAAYAAKEMLGDPVKEEGIDELPDKEGERPLDDDSTGLDRDRVREETDNAVLDRQQAPR
jgi:hypothetical protein